MTNLSKMNPCEYSHISQAQQQQQHCVIYTFLPPDGALNPGKILSHANIKCADKHCLIKKKYSYTYQKVFDSQLARYIYGDLCK